MAKNRKTNKLTSELNTSGDTGKFGKSEYSTDESATNTTFYH
jgi:hypothetical protein